MLQISYEWLQMLDKENIQLVILDVQADAELLNAIRSQPKSIVDFEDTEVTILTSAKSASVC